MSNFTQPQTYIKISKKDANGGDNTSALSQLQTITVPFSDGSKVVYDVLGITQYSNYFSYVVDFIPSSSLYMADFGKPEYDFTGSASTDLIPIPGSPNITTNYTSRNIPITSASKDDLGLYNSSTQTYNLDTYLQKDITIRATGEIDTSNIGTLTGLKLGIYIIPPTIQNPDGFGNPYVFSTTPSFFNTLSPNPSSFDISYTAPIDSIIPGSRIELRGIAGINPANIPLNSGNLFVSSTPATGVSSSVVLEPFFDYKFSNSGCDVLLGEVQEARPNKYLQDLDYGTSQTVPVNYLAILNNTATRATVPFSNYTQKASINPRYNGTKNQSSGVNVYDPLAGTSSFGTPINIGTYGQTPSISVSDVNIYEFEWGGGTNPEIQGFGALSMGPILQVDDKDSVRTINPSEGFQTIPILPNLPYPFSEIPSEWGRNATVKQKVNDYYYIFNRNNPINTRVSLRLYNDGTAASPVYPSTTQILTTEYGVPTRSTFMLTSSTDVGTSPQGRLHYFEYDYTPPATGSAIYPPAFDTGLPTTSSFVVLFENRTMNIVNSNYSPGTTVSPTILVSGSSQGINNFSFIPLVEQLNNGERWFMTFYENLEAGFDSDTLIPLHYNNSVLGQKGVVEIAGATQRSSNDDIYLILKDIADPNTLASGSIVPSSNMSRNLGKGDLGFFIWQARAAGDNEFVMVQDLVTGGVGKGAFTNEFAPTYLTENFQDITKTYGSNTQ
jgi:hypothetical protein